MKLKNAVITTLAISLVFARADAKIVYCPASLVCDQNANCTTTQDNGFSNWTVAHFLKYTPGTYYLVTVFGAAASCWYDNVTDYFSTIAITSSNNYFTTGPNWTTLHGAPVCPTISSWGIHEFVVPQACAFTTIPPSEK